MGERRTFLVACLAGHGIGPEVMAEASRALAHVSRLHGFRVQESHPPFGGEAVPQSGRPFPALTRHAALAADAVLVAGASEPALDALKAELALAASVTRTLLPDGGGVTVFAPLDDSGVDWTIERALASARARTGRIVSVGTQDSWRERVAFHVERDGAVAHRNMALAEALHALSTPSASLGVVVTERVLGDAIADAPRGGRGRPLRASGLLSPLGPGLFGPTHGSARDIAGQGVANPSEMLLAAALMLGEGLERWAAAQTLEESLAAALGRKVRTPDMIRSGVASTTREFVDVVLGLLPSARRDTEFALGGTP